MPTTPSRPEVPRTVVRSGQADAGIVARRTRRFYTLVAASLSLLANACKGSDPVQPGSASVSHGAFMGNGTVGALLDQPARFTVLDDEGNPRPNVSVHWTPSADGRVSTADVQTDDKGVAETRWTLGTVAGMQTLSARASDGSEQEFSANATADRPATVSLATDAARLVILGDTLRLRSYVMDRYGNSITTDPVFSIESGADAITIPSPGAFVARARGVARVRVLADTARTILTITVSPAIPVVERVSPDTLTPGASITLVGNSFALLPEFVELTVGGVRAVINRVTETTIEATLPGSGAFPCTATGPQPVRVTVAGSAGQLLVPLAVAKRVKLATGESANILDIQQARCTELVQPESPQRAKYILAVLNTSVTAATYSGFELHASGGGLLANQVASAQIEASRIVAPSNQLARSEAAFKEVVAEERGHAEFLEKQRATAAQYGSPVAAFNRIRAASGNIAAVRIAPSVGDTVAMKAIYSSCSVGRDVRARVVYTGIKSLILEDVLSPRAGQMDAQYRSMGQEFDAVQYPLLRANLGDPLAMDASLGGDGRVTMLFTRYVNDSLPGIQGYATACNFYPKATFAPSNEDEVFYARVASSGEDPEAWRRSMRSTVLHESKHLASFAERLSRNIPLEESWLEESTARIAEELYSRTFAGGGSWKGNGGYESTVRCEIYQCDDRPLMMWKHFSVLHQFFRGVDTLTPIGAAASGDFTFYASGWSLVRWAADQYAVDESEWLRALVRGGAQTGLANLALRSGHSVDEMLADWSLANAVDDMGPFIAAQPTLTFPSWNMPNIMNGLASADPGRFGDVTPLKIRAFTFGSAALPVAKLRAFSSSYFSFEGQQTGSQVVELRGENGGALPPTLRVAIVRVE